jgi:hypothetical protein
VADNCVLVANAPPLDCDSDSDGYGNACDGDFNNDTFVDPTDFTTVFLPSFTGTPIGGTDMNCDRFVDPTDFTAYFLPQFSAGVPGPSGLSCAGFPSCH